MAIRQPKNHPAPPKRPSWQSRYHGVRMTPEEYLALPEEKPYLEYVDGVVIQKPMPTDEHPDLQMYIAYELETWVRSRGGRVRVEARAAIGDVPSYRLPDVSFWMAEADHGNDSVPPLAIEIRSRSQTLAELQAKCRQFLSAGTRECWIVDPVSESVLVMRLDAELTSLPGTAELTSELIPGFALSLATLFAAAK